MLFYSCTEHFINVAFSFYPRVDRLCLVIGLSRWMSRYYRSSSSTLFSTVLEYSHNRSFIQDSSEEHFQVTTLLCLSIHVRTKHFINVTFSLHPRADQLCLVIGLSRWMSRYYRNSSSTLCLSVFKYSHNRSFIQDSSEEHFQVTTLSCFSRTTSS